MIDKQIDIENIINNDKSSLSHDNVLLQIYDLIDQQLHSDPDNEVTDQGNIIIQYICNRSQVIKDLFLMKWSDLIETVTHKALLV